MRTPPPYRSEDEREAIRNAFAMTGDLVGIAGKICGSIDEVREIVGLPPNREPVAADDSCDLWRADQLEDQL